MARARVVLRRSRRLARRSWFGVRRAFRQGSPALGLSTTAGFLGRGRVPEVAPRSGVSVHV
jgi:hypothetical protein